MCRNDSRVFRSAHACRNDSRVYLDLRGCADSAHGYDILCVQYCNLLALYVHALALFCPTFNAIDNLLTWGPHVDSIQVLSREVYADARCK